MMEREMVKKMERKTEKGGNEEDSGNGKVK
jgi:hypothetical protein